MIETFLINSAFIFGIRALVSPGMIGFFLVKRFYRYSDFTEEWKFNGPMWHKALYACAPCQSSIWGTLGFILFVYPELSLLYLPIYVISLAGINYIIGNLFSK